MIFQNNMQKEPVAKMSYKHLYFIKLFSFFVVGFVFTAKGQAQNGLRQDTVSPQQDSLFISPSILNSVQIISWSDAQKIERQGYNVNSLSTRKLKATNTDVQALLEQVPGIRIMEEGGLGSGMDLTLNGFTGNQVKIFIDGIPMNHYSASLGLSSIPVNAIQRIDVYKGVVPVSLGTDALGGAINIITNRTHNFLDVSYTYGSFNTHRASINGAYTNPTSGFTVRGSINYNYSDNDYEVYVPIVKNNSVERYDNVDRFHGRYRSGNIRAEAGWVNKSFADQLLFGVLASKGDKQIQNGVTMATPYGGIMHKSHTIVPSLKYVKKDLFVSGLDVNLYAAYNISQSKVVDTLRGVKYNWLGETISVPGSEGELHRTRSTLDDKVFNSGLNVSYEISDNHALVGNYTLSTFKRDIFDKEHPQKVENQFSKSMTKNIWGLAYKYNLDDKWKATAFFKYYRLYVRGNKEYDFGLPSYRIAVFEQTKDNFGYGFATTFFPFKGLQLKASYEHTYRMPSAFEIFGDGLFTKPNPELGPEQSDNINLGISYRFGFETNHHISLGSNFIYRNADDLIHQVVKVGSPVTHFANLSHTRTLGVAGSINYNWNNFFHLNANITFQDITDQADFIYNESYTNTGYQPNYHKGYRIPNIPYLFANASAGFKFDNVILDHSVLKLNYQYNYVHEYFLTWAELGTQDTKKIIPTQSSHNIELTYAVGHYSISFELRNLTDERLYDKYFLQKPGRAFYIKLRFTL